MKLSKKLNRLELRKLIMENLSLINEDGLEKNIKKLIKLSKKINRLEFDETDPATKILINANDEKYKKIKELKEVSFPFKENLELYLENFPGHIQTIQYSFHEPFKINEKESKLEKQKHVLVLTGIGPFKFKKLLRSKNKNYIVDANYVPEVKMKPVITYG